MNYDIHRVIRQREINGATRRALMLIQVFNAYIAATPPGLKRDILINQRNMHFFRMVITPHDLVASTRSQ